MCLKIWNIWLVNRTLDKTSEDLTDLMSNRTVGNLTREPSATSDSGKKKGRLLARNQRPIKVELERQVT